MSLSLGTLEIGLGLNTSQYDAGIKSAKDQLSSLEQKVITPKVDHRPLDALNQHLTVKENHYDKLNKKIIAPKVNHVALEALNEYLTVTENRIDEFNKKVIKVQVDDTELLALQKQLEETLALQNQVIESSKETTIKPTTDSQNLTKLQKDHEKTNIAQEKTRKKANQNVSITTNNQNLTKLDQQHKQTQIKTIPVTTEQQSTIQKPSSVEQQNITQRPVAPEQQNISQRPNIRGGGFSAMVAVELLSQILSGSLTKILSAVLPAILKVVETRKNFVSAVMSMPANFLKSYSEGAAYTYADIFTRNNIKAFDKEAGTNLYETGGSDLGKLAGKTVRKGKTVLNEHLETESAQKGSEAIADATKRTKEEMAELKKLAIEFYNTQDPSKAQELAEQLLKVSNSMRQVAMSPIDTFANARKELKSGESIAKARKQSATVQLDEKAVSEAEKIVFVSGGFAGKQGEGSKEIAENLQPKLEDGVLVIPIANKATDLSTSIKDNPLKWAGEAAAQTVGQGLSGTNEDSVSMLAAVIKARELNPNAQIDLLGYSAGGFVSEGATRLANQAGIENIKGVAIATPSMVGTTQMDNFSRYIGENDPIRLAEQTMGASDVSKQSQVISDIASHSSSDYLENAEIIKILNKEVDKLQENIEDIPDQLELFDMSSLQLKQRELVAIETQLKEVKEATKPLEHLKVDSIVATNIPNIKLGTEEKSFEIPSISSKNNPSKNITTDNKVSSDTGVKEKEIVSLSKQTKDLKSLIQSNPASADIVKAQAQTDAIRKWFSDRYQKLKTLIDSGELDQAKKVANEILIAKEQASSDLEDILKLLKEAGQPTSIASGGVGASVQSAKGYLSSTGKKVQTAQETIGIKELSPIKSGLIQQIQKTGVDTTTVGFKTLFAKAIEQSAKSIASGGNKELIETNLEKLILSLNPVLVNKNKTKGLGSDIIEGIKLGIKSESGDLDAEMREIALTLPKIIRDTLEIQSPSKVMMRIGRDIKRGLILGLDGIKTELKFKEIEIKDFVGKVKSLDRESLKTNVQKAGKRIFNALPSNVRNEVKFRQWEMEESAKQMQPLNRETIKTNIKQVGRKVFNIGGIFDKIDDFKGKSKLEQFSTIADKVERSLDKLPEPIKKVAGLIRNAILGIVGFNVLESTIGLLNKFGKEAFQTAIEAERLEMALSLTTDDAESALSRLKVQADKLGTSFLSSAKNYQQFSAAVMNTSLEFQKDKIFEGITLGLATRGANSQQQDRALLAITQIASKGRVSMEELNSQLGEAMPGALQIAARAYGVTSQEFIKLIESGSVASDEFLSKFATQTTLESAGGINVINDTAFAQVAKLENQLNLLRVEMGKPLLEVAKLGIPTVISGLGNLEDHGDKIVATFVSMGIVVSGVFVQMLHRLGLLKLGLKALGVTAASTKASIAQIGIGFVKGLGWTALIFGVMEAFKGLYQYINAGSEESKRSLKSTQESLQELRRLLEKPLPTPKASTVITDSATAIQQFKNNREKDKSLEFTAGGLSDTTQILKLSTDTFSDTKITEFTGKLDALRQKAKDLKIDEIIASGDADVKKATSVRQEIAKVNQEIQALTEKYFPQIGLIVNEIASTEERITAIKKVLDDPESSNSQKDNASIQLEITEVQLRKLKESQEKYNEAVKENLVNYQRLTEQINKVARALSNIEFVSSGRTILSETDIKRQVLSGNLKPFEIDLTVRKQSLSIVKDQFNSLNELLATKEKELQNTLTDQINQRITELMPELNGIDFRTALQQGSVSPEAIGDRLQQLGDQAPFELKQVLETAKQQASIRRQTLTIDKSIVDTELEIANARRERARNARQASIVGANVNERIATLRQLPFGGPAASYRDALSEVRNQERLLGEAYLRLESASDDPNVIQQEVDNTRLALEQARANLLQQKTSLQDYYRNLGRQIIDFNRQIEDYRRRIEDAQLSAFKENRSLSESYSDLVRELDKNLLNAQNQLLDTTDRIRVQQVKNRLLIPGTSDAGKELGDIFLEFVQGQADLASRGRTFQSRTEEIETSYISTLRNIRNLQEQQQEAERNRLRTIEDIKRTQEDLNRTLADLIRQTNKELGFIPQSIKDIVTNLNTLPEPIKLINKELGFIPQSIKDIVTNLNTLPEPIKLINSELVAIPPNIKTSGEDLVKSIEETAEAIRKAKEGLILPAPSNFTPAPVWNGGGFLPTPPPQSSSIPKGLTPRGQELSQHLNNPLVKAFLDTIAYAEGTANMPNKGYNTLFGYGQFSSFADHPRRRIPFGSTTSSASGRYQIMDFTWDEEKAKLGLKDFSPFSQDLVALSRILMRGGLDELLKGDIRGAINATRKEWASFPGANYPGQGMKRMEDLLKVYEQFLQKYQLNTPRTQSELDALRYDGNPANSGALNRIQQIRRNQGGSPTPSISTPNPSPARVLTKEETKEGKGGPEFSSPPPIAQLPTLPNQNQDNFWDADLPPVPKDNPINFQSPNLPPVPNLPTGNLGAAADQNRNAEIANQNAEEFLRRLEEQQNLNNALDRSMKFRRQQEEDARALERTLRDASENVADLTINSKGYLTVQEEINKSATEVSRQYRSQIESLEDQRRTLLLNAEAQQKYSDAIKEILGEFQRKGIALPPEFIKEMTDSIEVLAKNAELAKEQVAILDQAIEQLGKNQGVATLEASFRKTRDTVRSIRDRLNDLTVQRLKLENQSRPTLFDDSAILAERISLQKEKEELEDYLEPYKDLPQYADFVANIRSEWEKLAELRLERAELDASPNRGAAESFFSDIREGKGIGSAFSSLGLNIATKFVEGITKPAIDALTSAIDGFAKPITQAFESVFNAIIGPVGNFFTNALNSIFKPVGNIFSSIFGGGGGGGLFNGLLSGITGIFSGGLGGLGSIGSLGSIGASSFASAPASAFSLGTGFSLFSDGGKVGDANVPIEKNIISAFQRERAMSGGRKPRLIVANEGELVLTPKETEAYLDYRNNAPIKNYANGGFVGGKPNYSTTSNNNSSNQSLVINNTNNVTVESRNDMGYSLNQLKERENTQNERTKKRFFG
jgi:tape measure domain-containing protein